MSDASIPSAEGRDEAAVRATIEAITGGADLRQWEAVRAAFAPEVDLDYGTPERLSRDAIVARWRPLFAGFDATRHALDGLAVRVEGDAATATSRFEATHVLRGAPGGDVWRLTGRYELALARSASGWAVTRMRMLPEASTGNAALPTAALARGR
jgi:uncharacterized protein